MIKLLTGISMMLGSLWIPAYLLSNDEKCRYISGIIPWEECTHSWWAFPLVVTAVFVFCGGVCILSLIGDKR